MEDSRQNSENTFLFVSKISALVIQRAVTQSLGKALYKARFKSGAEAYRARLCGSQVLQSSIARPAHICVDRSRFLAIV